MSEPGSMAGRTAIITGASRGIGRAIALKLANAGANVVVAAKSAEPHPTLAGTIHSVVEEIKAAGGTALAVAVDVRDETQVQALAKTAADHFNGIDILINNAGAINIGNIENTPLKKFDLMWQVNTRAVYACSQAVLPWLKQSDYGHIINLSPPLSLNPQWFSSFSPYTLSKYGMSLLTLGLGEELRKYNVLVNSIWPQTIIATAAIEKQMGGEKAFKLARKPEIVADAVYALLKARNASLSGQVLMDEDCLRSAGITQFDHYAYSSSDQLMRDLFVDPPVSGT